MGAGSDPLVRRRHRLHRIEIGSLPRSGRHRPGLDAGGAVRPDLIAFEPDPKSRIGASRFIGESPAAGMVLVVVGYRDLDGDLHGINAWPATGPDMALYVAGVRDGEDD